MVGLALWLAVSARRSIEFGSSVVATEAWFPLRLRDQAFLHSMVPCPMGCPDPTHIPSPCRDLAPGGDTRCKITAEGWRVGKSSLEGGGSLSAVGGVVSPPYGTGGP